MIVELCTVLCISVGYLSGFVLACCSRERRKHVKTIIHSVPSLVKSSMMDIVYGTRPCGLNQVHREAYICHNNTVYKVPIVIKKGIKRVPCLTDIHGNDLSVKLKPYLGPNFDFFGIKMTPKMLGYPDGMVVNGDTIGPDTPLSL